MPFGDEELEAVIDGVRYDPRYAAGMMRPIAELGRQHEAICRAQSRFFSARESGNPEQAEAHISDALRSLEEAENLNACAAERLAVRRAKFILE